ncbi:MAG: methionyl-tRNA formyltransferase [Prochlorothrix sp.]|nr:methionyl-tRNA formyltransferase [Prochlorothrix sp.]
MKIVFFGTPAFAVSSLQALLDRPNLEVIAIVTQPDKRRGRGSQLIPSPVKALALEHQLPVWQPDRLRKDPNTLAQLEATPADVFVVVAYGQLLPPAVLAMPRLGCINVHGSLLPAYRGAAPIQWCLYRGETETGITTMLMDEGMDTGAMLQKATVQIPLLMQAQELGEQLAQVGADLLVQTLAELEAGSIAPEPQNPDLATYAPLIKKEDYQLDWSRSALDLHNQIRGFYPHCNTTVRDQNLKLKATVPLGLGLALPDPYQTLQNWQAPTDTGNSSLEQPQPGTIVALLKNQGVAVQTGAGVLLLTQVQLAGKREQSGWDFANGLRLEPGEKLG